MRKVRYHCGDDRGWGLIRGSTQQDSPRRHPDPTLHAQGTRLSSRTHFWWTGILVAS